jgi:hypothetical protein
VAVTSTGFLGVALEWWREQPPIYRGLDDNVPAT